MTERSTIIVIHETIFQSYMRDASSFALFSSLIGIGWLIDSTVMQVCGALVAFMIIFSIAAGKAQRLTIQQARKRLDELEAAQ